MPGRISILTSLMVFGVLLLIFVTEGAGYAEPMARIVVEAGEHTRIDVPVCVGLEGISSGELALYEVEGSRRRPVAKQIEAAEPPRMWWIVSGTTRAGQRRVYELEAGRSYVEKSVFVKATKNDSFLELERQGRQILRYNHAPVPPPEGKSELFTRSGFIHPLWSPSGAVLTNIHPADHIHHVGIWMPWTKTKFEDKEVDFWNLGSGQGTVRFVNFLSTTSGPVYGGFEAEQEHVALKTAEGEKVVLKEVWDVRVYNVGGPEKGYWLVDFVSTQRCVADSPLYQEQYRYGGFGFRGAAEWEGENAMYLTSEGKSRKDGHGTRARWCAVAGAIKGKWAGVTMLSHPENFRHPEPMRIWPEGQVFFNWAPSQAGDWEMKPGEDHVFRYRMYVHEGKIEVADAERVWNDFGDPPKVKLEKISKEGRVVLFDGTDFSQWVGPGGKAVEWQIVGDAMEIAPRKGSIQTKENFRDFKLHIEFNVPEMPAGVKGQGRGNSGVYIQQRYEVQILDSYGLEAMNNGCGSLYRQRAPDKNVCKKPGEWQSYDITFRAARFEGEGKDAKKVKNARITVVQNGAVIHDDVELTNKTGAGRPEGPEPGPILLQDHGNKVQFRNIWVERLDSDEDR